MNTALSALIHGWSSAKDWIENVLPVDNVLLHIAVGMAIYWIAAKILNGRRAPLFAWALVLVTVLANEAVDLMVERWPNFPEQLWQGATDIFWTLALPTVALLLARPPRPLFYADAKATDQPA